MKTRPFVPTLDELQRLLNVEDPGDLPDAVRELQAQNEAYQRGIEATKELLDKLNELIILDKIEQILRQQSRRPADCPHGHWAARQRCAGSATGATADP